MYKSYNFTFSSPVWQREPLSIELNCKTNYNSIMEWQKHYWLRLRHYYEVLDKCFHIHFAITDTANTINMAKVYGRLL